MAFFVSSAIFWAEDRNRVWISNNGPTSELECRRTNFALLDFFFFFTKFAGQVSLLALVDHNSATQKYFSAIPKGCHVNRPPETPLKSLRFQQPFKSFFANPDLVFWWLMHISVYASFPPSLSPYTRNTCISHKKKLWQNYRKKLTCKIKSRAADRGRKLAETNEEKNPPKREKDPKNIFEKFLMDLHTIVGASERHFLVPMKGKLAYHWKGMMPNGFQPLMIDFRALT